MRNILCLVLWLFALPCFSQLKLLKKDESCAGKNNGRLEAVVMGVPGKHKYAWKDLTNNVMLPDTESVISNLKPGRYEVTVTVANVCMDTKAAIIWPGKVLSLTISSQHVSHTPTPIPCGVRPTMTFLLTAQASGGTPPYYCSWSEGGDTEGTCTKVVTGKDFEELLFVYDDSSCIAKQVWTHRVLTKICPKDPNDITGPDGYDTARWVSVDDELDYTVRFENDPVFATSSASTVLVTVPIDDDIDPFSFRLGAIGFGSQIIELPDNQTSFQQRFDFSASIGYMVDVTAGLDIPNGRFFWLLETIDPLTGQPPLDPTAGFLPVNDTLTGSGEGFIHFVCKAKPSTPTGEYIEKQASIVFDANEPIVTNTWINKVDAVGPTTIHGILPDTFQTNTVPFTWIVNDDPGGCGVQNAQVMISLDKYNFESSAIISDSNQASITLDWDTKYYYRIIGTDYVGNRELPALDSFYIIPERRIDFLTPDKDMYCLGDTLLLDVILTSIPSIDLTYSLDSGETFLPIMEDLSAFPFAIVLDSTFLHPNVLLRARNEDEGLQLVSFPFTVNGLPELVLSDPPIGCDNEILFVEAEGANDFVWFPDSIMGTPYNRFSNVYADVSQYAYVEGTDEHGCKNIDSVYLTIFSSSRDTLIQPLCNGDSININGTWISGEGYYENTYASFHNCDSIIVSQVYFEAPCLWRHGPYVYVDIDATGNNDGTSWENAFNELRDAVYVAGRYENVQEIWVAEGEYLPHPARRDTSFILKDSIRIYGGFLGVETTRAQRTANPSLVKISGDINIPGTLSDNSYHTLRLLPSCDSCIIDGVTITYGHANQPTNQNDTGAGVINEGVGYFHNVIFEHNYATDYGAAVRSVGNSAHIIIEGCIFRLNTSSMGTDLINLSGAQMEFRGINSIQN